jgi:hypothetical protein
MITSKLADRLSEAFRGMVNSHLDVIQSEIEESDGNEARFSVSVHMSSANSEAKMTASFKRAPISQSVTIELEDPNQVTMEFDKSDFEAVEQDAEEGATPSDDEEFE